MITSKMRHKPKRPTNDDYSKSRGEQYFSEKLASSTQRMSEEVFFTICRKLVK